MKIHKDPAGIKFFFIYKKNVCSSRVPLQLLDEVHDMNLGFIDISRKN